jgi:hypothetical protein
VGFAIGSVTRTRQHIALAQPTNLAAFTRVSCSSPAPLLSNSCNGVGQARACKSPRNAVNSPKRRYAPPPPQINPPHPRVSRQRAAACCRRTPQAPPLPRRTPPRQPARRQHHRPRRVHGGHGNLGRHKTFIPSRRFVVSKSRRLHDLRHLMMLLRARCCRMAHATDEKHSTAPACPRPTRRR